MSRGKKIQVDPQVINTARKEFFDFSADFDHVRKAVVRDALLVREGAGEFVDLVEHGTEAFEASWLMVTKVASASAETVATNMGQMTLDLAALDSLM